MKNSKLSTYLIGVSWFILSLIISVINDITTKYLSFRLHSIEIAFFRFFFSTIILVPFIMYFGKQILKTNYLFVHIVRGVLLLFGMALWTYGLSIVPVTTATVVSFAIPLFTLVLAVFFLNENIIWQRWVVTFCGFIGVIITLKPHALDFNQQTLIFILASLTFAMLDILNKKFVVKESIISMLFYSALVTTIISLPPSIIYWQTPTIQELILLFILGSGGSVILFCLLKAFSIVDATAIVPYRYLELLISASSAYLLLHEIPQKSALYGALIIIPATFFVICAERKTITQERNKVVIHTKILS